MEVDFENIMDYESPDEEMLSDDSGYASDMSEYEIDRVKKFVSAPEIRTLNARTKLCDPQMGAALTICTACMIYKADINDVEMYHVREHETDSFGKLDGRSCMNCRESLYNIFPYSMRPLCTY